MTPTSWARRRKRASSQRSTFRARRHPVGLRPQGTKSSQAHLRDGERPAPGVARVRDLWFTEVKDPDDPTKTNKHPGQRRQQEGEEVAGRLDPAGRPRADEGVREADQRREPRQGNGSRSTPRRVRRLPQGHGQGPGARTRQVATSIGIATNSKTQNKGVTDKTGYARAAFSPDSSPREAWGVEPSTPGAPGVAPRTSTADESACRPGFVALLRGRTVIHLGPALPSASSGLPVGSGRLPSNACAGPPRWALLDLAPGGVYLAAPVTWGAGGLLHHRFTLTSDEAEAVCSLWHCPAGRPGSVLPTTLPCGARTFLAGDPEGSPPRPPGRLVRRTHDPSLSNDAYRSAIVRPPGRPHTSPRRTTTIRPGASGTEMTAGLPGPGVRAS